MPQRSTIYYTVLRERGENWDARLPMRQQEQWAEGGVLPHVVSAIVGHSDVSITLGVYGHVLRDMHEDAMHKMEGLFGG